MDNQTYCADNVSDNGNNGVVTASNITHEDNVVVRTSNDEFPEFIVAIFVVIFDTKKGNLTEWCIPEDVSIKGVEFKALVSGSHTISQDFVYFRHQHYYGLSCFALKSVANVEERGARMKSVGIICTKYTSLHKHQEFLEAQVRKQLDVPYHYDDLIKYFIRYRNCPQQNNYVTSPVNNLIRTSDINTGVLFQPGIEDLPMMKITHPTGCFSQFIKYFGVDIFSLWRFILLKKRILFVAPPPVGVQCYRVYCADLLHSNGMGLYRDFGTSLLFNVGLCDIDVVSSLDAYIACSTDSIFQTKPRLYDMYVDRQKLICSNNYYKKIITVNSADRDRFTRLCKYQNEQLRAGNEVGDDEKMYTRFFIELNNRLFKIIHEVATYKDPTLTASHIREIGLDPYCDRLFLKELIEIHNITISIPEMSCCS